MGNWIRDTGPSTRSAPHFPEPNHHNFVWPVTSQFMRLCPQPGRENLGGEPRWAISGTIIRMGCEPMFALLFGFTPPPGSVGLLKGRTVLLRTFGKQLADSEKALRQKTVPRVLPPSRFAGILDNLP